MQHKQEQCAGNCSLNTQHGAYFELQINIFCYNFFFHVNNYGYKYSKVAFNYHIMAVSFFSVE